MNDNFDLIDLDKAEAQELKEQQSNASQPNEQKPLMWNFNGTDYPMFVADKTGNIGVPIIHPTTEKKVAVIGANFNWAHHAPNFSQPFLEHLNLNIEDITNVAQEISETKRKNLTTQNVNLFDSLIQDGWLTKINEFGESGEQQPKSREQMLSYPNDIKSQLIDEWLGRFVIERHFPEGVDEVDILLGQVDSVFFKCSIGTAKNPAHVLILEFKLPSNDAQRSYDDDTRRETRPTDRPNVRIIEIKHNVKLQYAKKHLIGVQGAGVVDGENLVPITNDTSLKEFKGGFCPQWLIRLADALHGTFNIMGK